MFASSTITTIDCPLFVYRVIDTAARQLTKTAITVTAIFIVALGYDLWFYLFAHLGLIEYKMNTPSQKIGKLVSMLACKKSNCNIRL